MLEKIINSLIAISAFPLFLGTIFFICYIAEEQNHRHKIELKKAEFGIFDEPVARNSFFKKYGTNIIIIFLISIIIVGICYIFKVIYETTK